jgi:DNA-binding transcriptional MerR regulator/methylmalonyl-CoA mutase cobalamin-binding subunit
VTDDDPGGHPQEPERGELSMEQVSKLLGLPAPTIRSWERRHGVPVASRTSGGHRRYSPEQVDLLRRFRDLVAEGRRPGEAAEQLASQQQLAPEAIIEAYLNAARDLSPTGIAATLEAAERSLGLARTIDEVLLPALRQVGEWWQHDENEVLHEHLATHATHSWLTGIGPVGVRRPPHRPLILCCGPRDHHSLGLEAIGALLRRRGWDCRLLGARTPGDALVRAVQETGAAAVVLVSHLAVARAAAVTVLHAVEPSRVQVFYAGGAFTSPQSRRGVPGTYLGTSLSGAADLITGVLETSGGAGPLTGDPGGRPDVGRAGPLSARRR